MSGWGVLRVACCVLHKQRCVLPTHPARYWQALEDLAEKE